MPDFVYSPRRRTALVLTGSGTAGAYHAGVLRALHEAGVKIDLVAGRGIGAAGAIYAAGDGAARLWDVRGFWRSAEAARAYAWRPGLRAAGWVAAGVAVVLLSPLALLGLAVVVHLFGLLLTAVGLPSAGTAVATGYTRALDWLFSPAAIPTVVPRLVVLALLAVLGVFTAATVRSVWRSRRRRRGGIWWDVPGSPLSARPLVNRYKADLWQLIRGAAPIGQPPDAELGRRYAELLTENLGQPGFRELLVVVHDIDARRDLVFALLSERYRQPFFSRRDQDPVTGSAERVDLSGVGRDHVLDALQGALSLPVGSDPHQMTFAPESYWRGETHRLCDRPGGLGRLFEELAEAGVEQLVVVEAAPPPGEPHQLGGTRRDLLGRAGEYLASFERAAVSDARARAAARFKAVFEIRPAHNPLGPLDFAGAYDERSDRRYTLAELIDRGYEDAYRQFIDPVVGASGEALEQRTVLS